MRARVGLHLWAVAVLLSACNPLTSASPSTDSSYHPGAGGSSGTYFTADPGTSLLAVSASSIQFGQASTLTLTAKDTNGIQNTTGGQTVTFSASSGLGVSTGAIGVTTDHGNGTYTAIFTATSKGTATTVTATIAAAGAVTQTQTITVINTPPVITPLSQSTYPADGTTPPLIQRSSYTLATTSDVDTGDTVALSCSYQTLGLNSSDPNYAAAGTNCNTLSSLGTTNGTTVLTTLTNGGSSITWTPTDTQRGTYEFSLTATDGTNAATPQSLIVTVRENDTITNLLAGLDALDATNASGLSASTASSPLTTSSTASSWLDLMTAGTNGTLSFGTVNPWLGTGQSSSSSVDPYRLSFTSANSDSMSLSTVLSTATQIGVETWVKPGSPSTAGSVIASNGGGSGNGFVLRQSSTPTGRAEFVVGKKFYSYRDLVLSDNPIVYLRLDETSGAVAADTSASGSNGAYNGTASYSQAGALSGSGDVDSSIGFDGSTTYVTTATAPFDPSTTDFSAETWVKFNSVAAQENILNQQNGTGTGRSWVYLDATAKFSSFLGGSAHSSGISAVAGTWYHVVFTKSGTTCTIYINGVSTPTFTVTTESANGGLILGRAIAGGLFLSGFLDDMSVYNYALTAQQVTNHYNSGATGNYVTYPGNAILANKPVGYWRLGEKSGSAAYDYSGNGNQGTYVGGVSLGKTGALALAGDSDSAALFDGSTGTVSIPNSVSFTNLTNLTLMGWVKIPTTATSDNRIISQQAGSYWLLDIANNKLAGWFSLDGIGGTSFGSALNDGNWHQVAISRNTHSELVTWWVDGVSVGSLATASAAAYNVGSSAYIGSINGTGQYFNGYLDEIAVFNSALSATQISTIYNSGHGPGWWYCQSQTLLNSSNWNFLSSLWNGTFNTLFVNGQQECQTNPGTTYSGAVANTTIAEAPSGGSFWQGVMSIFKAFGSTTTAPISSTTVQADFSAEANRFRSVPRENTVTSGIILDLDPANAQAGLTQFAAGCTSTELNWYDLSPSSNNGALTSFAACGASSGWNGTGTVASPYVLSLNGTSNYVNLGSASVLEPSGAMTVAAWVKAPAAGQGSYPQIVSNGDATGVTGFNLYYYNNTAQGQPSFIVKEGANAWGNCLAHTATNYLDGNWHYLVGVYTGTNISIYVDGNTPTTTACQNAAVNYGTSPVGAIGDKDAANYLSGSVGPVQMYSRALSQQEIKQNCLAEQGRFTSTANICAAP